MLKFLRVGLLAATTMAAAGTMLAAPAMARTNHAVLVAVTAYPGLPPKASLVGPNHDAKLVRDYLLSSAPVAFDEANVTLLADNLDGAAASPTHEHILDALKAVAEGAERDDFVYLHFSGHGAQQPALEPGSETDGLDEIFLPADTAKWADRTKGVPNALMDNEIGAALDAIRDKGAFVWIIFDACHSGDATRDIAPAGEHDRKVEFDDLGIPDSAVQAAMAEAAATPQEAEAARREAAFELGTSSRGIDAGADQSATGAQSIAKGGMVAFFAAQTIETTPEMPLPKGTPGAESYGLFTYTIFSKLAENPNMTYRQLGHAVLQQYSADARQRPTPLFEGELDARVFGSEKIDTVMQWQVEAKDGKAGLPAGLLHRLTPGTKLAVLPSPASELSETLGYLEVKSAKNLTSTVVPVAFEGKPALDLAAMPANAYARLVELAVDYRLKVARPAGGDGFDAEVALVDSALEKLATDGKGVNVEIVEPGAEADVRLAVMRGDAFPGAKYANVAGPALYFLPSSGDAGTATGEHPPLVAIDPSDPDRLAKGTADNLLKIFRATSLSRLAAASDYKPDQVNVQFMIRRDGADEMQPLETASVPVLMPDDEVHILAENKSTKLVDINILYVGSDYSITHIDAQRLVPGARIEEGLFAFTDTSFGRERMIAVLTEAPPLSEIEDLSFLAQPGVAKVTRDINAPVGFADMLADIGAAPSTRSVMKLGDKSGAKGAVMIFPMETTPRL
jgi:hypothetical protein